jgi:hypothetical protein
MNEKRTCKGCGGPLCEYCGGCKNEGECGCRSCDTSTLDDILTDFETEQGVTATTARARIAALQAVADAAQEYTAICKRVSDSGFDDFVATDTAFRNLEAKCAALERGR